MPEQTIHLAVDARAAAEQLHGAAMGLSASVAYELNDAIERTAALLQDCPRASVFARLSAHLDNLLAEQLRQVSVQPLPVIE